MKPNLVLNEDERRVRHEKRTARRVPRENHETSNEVTLYPELENIFCEDEKMFLVSLQQKWRSYMKQEMTIFYSNHPQVFKNVLRGLYFGTIIPYDSLQILDHAIEKNARNFFLSSKFSEEVSASDIQSLCDKNMQVMLTAGQSVILGKFYDIQGSLATV